MLLVEHAGQTQKLVEEKIKNTISAVGRLARNHRIVYDRRQQERLWKCRKDAGPLLERNKADKQPAEFMEDVSVDNSRLGEYITGLKKIAARYDIEMSFYGHAGDSELHLRPFLNLAQEDEVAKMRAIANDVFSLAWSLGGSISGEHAIGLARTDFIKKQYGRQYYELLTGVKNIFDPKNLLNPGKIITEQSDVMVKDLRAKHRVLPERLETPLLIGKSELISELLKCNGCGLCRSSEQSLRMCPVFRAVGEETAGPRAKANILLCWATGLLKERDFESPQFEKILELCINCRACSKQCPSGADIAKLITAMRAKLSTRKGLNRTQRILVMNRFFSALAAAFAPVSNALMQMPAFRYAFEKMTGLDRRRNMPAFETGPFLKAGRRYLETTKKIEKPADKVAYFVDTYANYNDHKLGFAALEVLQYNDIEVILPNQRPIPMPAVCYGDVKQACKDLRFIVKNMAEAVKKGYKIICSEPTAAMCLKEQLMYFVETEEARLVSENTYELMSYLVDMFRQGKLKPAANTVSESFVYHRPCHLIADGTEPAAVELLREKYSLNITDTNAGCCGLAGVFGMQTKNYALAMKIAENLAGELEKSPAKGVLTECSGCKIQIEQLTSKPVSHPITVLAKLYGRQK